MIFKKDGNIIIITQKTVSISELNKRTQAQYHKIENQNVIVNLSNLETVHLNGLIALLQLSNTHRKAEHSFVIVTNKIDLDEVPDELVVVPTMQEAYDIIEMEEMERDLGF